MAFQKYHLVKEANAFPVTDFMEHPKSLSLVLAAEPQLGPNSVLKTADSFRVVPQSTQEPHFPVDFFLINMRGTLRATGRRAKVRMDFYGLISRCPQSLCLGWMSCSCLGKGKPEKHDLGWIFRMDLLDGSPNLRHPHLPCICANVPSASRAFPACSFQWARTFCQVMRTWSRDAPSSCSTTALHPWCPALHL